MADELDAGRARIRSIDLLRGAVMVLMVIDHVRGYAGVPAFGADPAIFFTRWVTNFCAPVFVFFAGTSAFLSGKKRGELAMFLFTRGFWLIVLELTVLRFFWTFNLNFHQTAMAGVIWVLGVSMIALAALSRLPVGVVGAFGAIVVAGHNLLDGKMAGIGERLAGDPLAWLWKFLYVGPLAGPIQYASEGSALWVLYSLVPWVGLMALGYAFGALLVGDAQRRDRACLGLGLGAIALFLILRTFGLYGEPNTWTEAAENLPSWLAFLAASKYPASLQFLLMTLGPAIALIPALEKVRGAWARPIELFGRVPLFFYLLHIPVIHLLAIGVSLVRTGAVDPWLFANHPMVRPPSEEYVWNLPLLYLIWAIATVILYFACRAFAARKARHPDGWLRYL